MMDIEESVDTSEQKDVQAGSQLIKKVQSMDWKNNLGLLKKVFSKLRLLSVLAIAFSAAILILFGLVITVVMVSDNTPNQNYGHILYMMFFVPLAFMSGLSFIAAGKDSSSDSMKKIPIWGLAVTTAIIGTVIVIPNLIYLAKVIHTYSVCFRVWAGTLAYTAGHVTAWFAPDQTIMCKNIGVDYTLNIFIFVTFIWLVMSVLAITTTVLSYLIAAQYTYFMFAKGRVVLKSGIEKVKQQLTKSQIEGEEAGTHLSPDDEEHCRTVHKYVKSHLLDHGYTMDHATVLTGSDEYAHGYVGCHYPKEKNLEHYKIKN